MVVDTTHCLVAGAILLGKEELNIVSWTGRTIDPALRGNQQKKTKQRNIKSYKINNMNRLRPFGRVSQTSIGSAFIGSGRSAAEGSGGYPW